MNRPTIKFTAAIVECREALDWEMVQVTFDSCTDDLEEDDRTQPYLTLSASFEFDSTVNLEFFDGEDYNGDCLCSIDLWRERVHVVSRQGYEFPISFQIPDQSFQELREYIKVLMRNDVFRVS